ncbi:hypothetical protein NMY3_02290 [Candidatus Nitrosocosmicus oleophilus]|uniref:DUF371 domain-containing protein n=1 Tax=Candidatus Nitrosocosmicus oleophilus TaxID=1353260 RepID=A0A654LZZ0_9ARCH|nr:DUF371 domain-containing protein [Candidatus Nitrosocosmicus oleophilus]ALI36487.1 hypothetical protein NMY3_02290 [Candidatus Nitrosocosmicus oleophilus]
MLTEEIQFCGHKNIRSLHTRTIEITKDPNLTLNGDCIIGVSATKSCSDLTSAMKNKIRRNRSIVEIDLIVEPFSIKIHGIGNDNLLLTHLHDIVLRKSNFICDRTLCLSCNVSAIQIPRKMIDLLKDPSKQGLLVIGVE